MRRRKKKKGMPTIFPSGLRNPGCFTSLYPEQPWLPKLDCHRAEGAGKDVPANEFPLDLKCLVPYGWATISSTR